MNLKALYTRNLGLKLVSIVIASLIWLYVELGSEGNTRISVPVSIANLGPGLSLKEDIPAQVELEVHGSRIDLLRTGGGELRIVLDMAGVSEGTVRFTSLDKAVKLHRGLCVTRAYPSEIDVRVVKKQ